MRLSTAPRLLLGLGFVLSIAHAAEPMGGWKSLRGAIYLIHGGSLADRQLATAFAKFKVGTGLCSHETAV